MYMLVKISLGLARRVMIVFACGSVYGVVSMFLDAGGRFAM